MWQDTVMKYDKQNKLIDGALRGHYRETMERKHVPSDYLLMFTEGGESNAVADAIAKAQAPISYKQGVIDECLRIINLITNNGLKAFLDEQEKRIDEKAFGG